MRGHRVRPWCADVRPRHTGHSPKPGASTGAPAFWPFSEAAIFRHVRCVQELTPRVAETRNASRLYRHAIMDYGETMRSVRRLVSAGQVWLAAALTLFAGMPQFSCLCPGGGIKPASAAVVHESGCCAGCSCCQGRARHDVPSTAGHSCCARHHSRGSASPLASSSHCLTSTGCIRVIHRPDVALVAPSDSTSRHGPDAESLPLALTAGTPEAATSGASAALAWDTGHSWPPPQDLLSLLQHLLI
jgi:hypothetical protein